PGIVLTRTRPARRSASLRSCHPRTRSVPTSPLLEGTPRRARPAGGRARRGSRGGKPPGFPEPFPRAGAVRSREHPPLRVLVCFLFERPAGGGEERVLERLRAVQLLELVSGRERDELAAVE